MFEVGVSGAEGGIPVFADPLGQLITIGFFLATPLYCYLTAHLTR